MSVYMRDQRNVCKDCGAQLQFAGGCYFCPECGWGKCSRALETAGALLVLLVCLAAMVLS